LEVRAVERNSNRKKKAKITKQTTFVSAGGKAFHCYQFFLFHVKALNCSSHRNFDVVPLSGFTISLRRKRKSYIWDVY